MKRKSMRSRFSRAARDLREARDLRSAGAALRSAERGLIASGKPVARRRVFQTRNGVVQRVLRKLLRILG